MIEIIPCLLDENSSIDAGGMSLGELIRNKGGHELWAPRKSAQIDTVIIHYISALTADQADPYSLPAILRIFAFYGVSSHYLISRDGTIYLLVPEDKKAWHCGGSIMPLPDRRTGVNEFSLGIELVATAESGFCAEQYAACAQLCADIETRHKIMHYAGHEDIAGNEAVALGLRKDIKHDPGPLFNWERFLREKQEAGLAKLSSQA